MRARSFGVLFGVVLTCSTVLSKVPVEKNAPGITIQEWITEDPPTARDLVGRVYVLEFWATWCRSCVVNIPHLNEFNNKYSLRGLEFIALSQDKSAEQLREFVRKHKINYSVAIDNGTVDWFGIRAYPTMVLVNHRGKVVWQGYPWSSGFERAITQAIEAAPAPLLAGVDLGPFTHLRKALSGGSRFAKAYGELCSWARTQNQHKKSAVAQQLVEIINGRIFQKTNHARQIRTEDPLEAYYVYADIVAKYEGVEAAEPATTEYLELRNCDEVKELMATRRAANPFIELHVSKDPEAGQ